LLIVYPSVNSHTRAHALPLPRWRKCAFASTQLKMATGAEHGLKKIVWQSKFIESKQLIFCKLLARTVQCFIIYMSLTQRKSCQKFKETHLVCWVCSEELQSPYEVVWVFVLEYNKETVRYGLCPVCLRYVCLGKCLVCVIESLFPLAALLMLACPAQLHWVLTLTILQELFLFLMKNGFIVGAQYVVMTPLSVWWCHEKLQFSRVHVLHSVNFISDFRSAVLWHLCP